MEKKKIILSYNALSHFAKSGLIHFKLYITNLAKDLVVIKLNQPWVADITYIYLPLGFAYLVAILGISSFCPFCFFSSSGICTVFLRNPAMPLTLRLVLLVISAGEKLFIDES